VKTSLAFAEILDVVCVWFMVIAET